MAASAQADSRPTADVVQRVIAVAFDAAFYRAVHPDLPPDVEPFWHYRLQGWQEGRDPAPWFSSKAYLDANADVRRGKLEPFFHFLAQGRYEGREIVASRHATTYYVGVDWAPPPWSHPALGAALGAVSDEGAAGTLPDANAKAAADMAVAAAFDRVFYLAINPDVLASGMDPLKHFLDTGWLEGRDPSADFSVQDYLDANPDVAAAGVNPFAHYLITGRAEGRAVRHDLGYEFDLISRLTPLEKRIEASVSASRRLVVGTADELARGLVALRPDVHITVSHDNYAQSAGGLQFCVRHEGECFAAIGRDHLHLFPAAPWHTVRAEEEYGPLGVLLNGRSLGVFRPEIIQSVLGRIRPTGRLSFAIHSLLGHAADATCDILAAVGLNSGTFWLHDFASLCAGVHLQRNDLLDCAAPPADSAACGICHYGAHRSRHTDAHSRLFSRLSLTVVAPSQTTLNFWRDRTALKPHDTLVRPLASLVSRGLAPQAPQSGPLRVAFLGMPSHLKGWPVFQELARTFAEDPRYAFLHLGGRPDPRVPVAFHPVMATAERPRAMLEAVTLLEIDVALIWPLCRETFSFTAYEAVAGGASVVTSPDSGNVAAFAAGRGRGRLLADVDALMAAFQSGDILSLARARRVTRRYELRYGQMSCGLMDDAR